ncbi:MAG: YbbR-like domain-containing protein [Bacteroidales bacterium]|nr:YbbR-like domain-containing protein [Bacteroidales bacterium]
MVSKKDKSQSFQQFSNILLFVTIAALLWLIIKLSANYTVTESLTMNFKDAPANLIITNDTQKINVTLSSRGFDLLHYYLKPVSRRKVDISLEEVPLHKDSESTYSFGSSYAKEKIANFLTIESGKISFDENKIMLNMEQLDSVRVKVVPDLDMSYEKQYNRHGKIGITPDSVTIYGPKNIIESIDNVYTENLVLKNINSNVNVDVPLRLEEMTNADTKNVNIKINVEKFTEAVTNVKISHDYHKQLRLFPDKVKIKYIVYLSEYNIINENSFVVRIDTADISPENNFLPIYLADYPNNTKIISIEPKEVEYIIIDENN